MEQSSSDKKTIQHQYDALAKKTLKGEAKNFQIELAKRAAREVSFSELSENELNQFYVMDEYESDFYRFPVSGYDVFVRNALLGSIRNPIRKKAEYRPLILFLGYERRGNRPTAECCTHNGFPAQENRPCENQTVYGGKSR